MQGSCARAMTAYRHDARCDHVVLYMIRTTLQMYCVVGRDNACCILCEAEAFVLACRLQYYIGVGWEI